MRARATAESRQIHEILLVAALLLVAAMLLPGCKRKPEGTWTLDRATSREVLRNQLAGGMAKLAANDAYSQSGSRAQAEFAAAMSGALFMPAADAMVAAQLDLIEIELKLRKNGSYELLLRGPFGGGTIPGTWAKGDGRIEFNPGTKDEFYGEIRGRRLYVYRQAGPKDPAWVDVVLKKNWF